jgi:hypothetical protein
MYAWSPRAVCEPDDKRSQAQAIMFDFECCHAGNDSSAMFSLERAHRSRR